MGACCMVIWGSFGNSIGVLIPFVYSLLPLLWYAVGRFHWACFGGVWNGGSGVFWIGLYRVYGRGAVAPCCGVSWGVGVCLSVAFIVPVLGCLERVFLWVCDVSLKANEKGAWSPLSEIKAELKQIQPLCTFHFVRTFSYLQQYQPLTPPIHLHLSFYWPYYKLAAQHSMRCFAAFFILKAFFRLCFFIFLCICK